MNWKSWSFEPEYACDSADNDKTKNIKTNRIDWVEKGSFTFKSTNFKGQRH